jgi:DNA-directed RNA polymerase subunit beta
MYDVADAKTGEVSSSPARRSARARQPGGQGRSQDVIIPTEEIFGRFSADDLINEKTGEIYIEAGDEVTEENLEKLDKAGIKTSSCSTSITSTPARGSATR